MRGLHLIEIRTGSLCQGAPCQLDLVDGELARRRLGRHGWMRHRRECAIQHAGEAAHLAQTHGDEWLACWQH